MNRMFFCVAAVALITCSATGANAKWVCKAPGLVKSSYNGGSTAYIHLRPYKRGNTYAVVKTKKGASGTTSNGTRFTCAKTG